VTDDHRARLLRAAVGFALLRADEPELRLLHRCFNAWRGIGGIGDVVAGMARREYDLELRRRSRTARKRELRELLRRAEELLGARAEAVS